MPFVLRIGPNQNSQLAAVGNLLPTPIVNVSATSTVAGQINLTWTGGVGNNVKYTYSVYNNTGSVLVSPIAYTVSGANPSTITFTDTVSKSYTVTVTANVLGGSVSRVSSAVTTFTGYKTPSVTSGLILHSDFSNPSTYSGTGASFTNLVDSTAQSIKTFNSGTYSYSSGYLILTNPVSSGGATYIELESYTFQTISLWFKPNNFVLGDYCFDGRNLIANSWCYMYSGNFNVGPDVSLYVNGGSLNTGITGTAVAGSLINVTVLLSSAATGKALIGCRYNLEQGWNVNLSRIVVYNRALSEAENTANYNAFV